MCYFGDYVSGTGDSYRLYEINVPVHSHEDCVEEWGPDRITVRQMCMGTEDKSACGVSSSRSKDNLACVIQSCVVSRSRSEKGQVSMWSI